MSDAQGVATKRRRLRTELRRLREAAGMHQSEVVKQLDWSISKLIRIENGSVGISVTDVRAIAAIYLADPATVEELVKLARVTRERQWWSSYRHVITPGYREFIGYEADATTMLQAHPTVVPGLLQTEDYTRAILDTTSLDRPSPERADAEVAVRRKRQEEILFGGHPPDFTVILDEAALLRHVGGLKVMRAQLEHLVRLSTDLVTIAVMPLRAGGYLGLPGAFHIMDFANEEDESVLFLETTTGNPIQREQEQVAKYRDGFHAMLARSMQGAEARDFIRSVAEQMQ